MSGRTHWNELNHKATPDQVDQARTALEEALTLGELRRAREMTQSQLAQALETTQPGVSAIEQRTDLYLSTLRSYIEALGGRLEITAVFPEGNIKVRSFTDLGERTIEYGVKTFTIDNGIVRVIALNLRDLRDADRPSAADLSDRFDDLREGRIAALHLEPGEIANSTLYEAIRSMSPPSGRLNQPFAQLRSELERDSAVVGKEALTTRH